MENNYINGSKKLNQKSDQGNTINATNPFLNSSSYQKKRLENKQAASNAFKNANIEIQAGSSELNKITSLNE